MRPHVLVLLALVWGCGSRGAPEAPIAPRELASEEEPAGIPEPAETETVGPALPPEGETELFICTLDAPFEADERAAIGVLEWRSDDVLVVAGDGSLRALDIERSSDCRLRAHSTFGEGGRWAREGLDASTAVLSGGPSHLYFADGSEVLRFDGDALVSSPLALHVSQLSTHPGGEYTLARVGGALVRITGEETLVSAPALLDLRARDLTFVSFVDESTLLLARRGPATLVHLDGAPGPDRNIAVPDEHFEMVRPASNSGFALLSMGEGGRIFLYAADGTLLRTVGVGASIDFALDFADPSEGPARVTGMTAVHDRVAYVTYEVTRHGHREGGLVRVAGL